MTEPESRDLRKSHRSRRRPAVDAARGLGNTVILVTHDQGEALSLAEQVRPAHDDRVRVTAGPDHTHVFEAETGDSLR
ncbi:hypothetical protein [Streptomyces sp. NPDC001604]|uniref:hypothetical protein n=1 Tax=Streptomyces sp. NPDC001604 TaxID=3364593 RepID=UPI00367BD6E1